MPQAGDLSVNISSPASMTIHLSPGGEIAGWPGCCSGCLNEEPLLTQSGRFVCCSLDTGRLNPETYRLFDMVEKRYNIRIEYTFPDAQETMDLVREKGMFSFYEDGHQECCRVRKVSRPPLCSPLCLSMYFMIAGGLSGGTPP
jgi:hypothetical protein